MTIRFCVDCLYHKHNAELGEHSCSHPRLIRNDLVTKEVILADCRSERNNNETACGYSGLLFIQK